MNQDFTVQKKQYLSEKKIRAEGFTWKKNSCTSSERKKKFVQAENSPPPPPPITFLMVRPFLGFWVSQTGYWPDFNLESFFLIINIFIYKKNWSICVKTVKTGVATRFLIVKDTERATTNLVPRFSLSRSLGTGRRERWERDWATTHSRHCKGFIPCTDLHVIIYM